MSSAKILRLTWPPDLSYRPFGNIRRASDTSLMGSSGYSFEPWTHTDIARLIPYSILFQFDAPEIFSSYDRSRKLEVQILESHNSSSSLLFRLLVLYCFQRTWYLLTLELMASLRLYNLCLQIKISKSRSKVRTVIIITLDMLIVWGSSLI